MVQSKRMAHQLQPGTKTSELPDLQPDNWSLAVQSHQKLDNRCKLQNKGAIVVGPSACRPSFIQSVLSWNAAYKVDAFETRANRLTLDP